MGAASYHHSTEVVSLSPGLLSRRVTSPGGRQLSDQTPVGTDRNPSQLLKVQLCCPHDHRKQTPCQSISRVDQAICAGLCPEESLLRCKLHWACPRLGQRGTLLWHVQVSMFVLAAVATAPNRLGAGIESTHLILTSTDSRLPSAPSMTRVRGAVSPSLLR